jgi:hypothetical protein
MWNAKVYSSVSRQLLLLIRDLSRVLLLFRILPRWRVSVHNDLKCMFAWEGCRGGYFLLKIRVVVTY